MAAQGTSNTQAIKRWVATGATDDLNIDSDNDTSTTVYFVHPAKIMRFAFQATTTVQTASDVKVEVYKNTSTLVMTWTVCGTGGVTAGKMAYAEARVNDNDGSTAEDGTTRYEAPTGFHVDAGDWIHFKVVEPASVAGAGVTWVEYLPEPVHEDSTGVMSVGSCA